MLDRLTATLEALAIWSRSFNEETRRIKRQCEITLKSLENATDVVSLGHLQNAKRKLGDILLQEEMYWKQRSKQYWLKEGDRNTRFFHSMASARKKIKNISRLKRDDGSWAEDREAIQVVKEYFQKIFEANGDNLNHSAALQRVRRRVTEDMNNDLTRPFTREEFKTAIFQMHPDKAPGPDRFNPAFYHKFCNVLHENVFMNGVKSLKWLVDEAFPDSLNTTHVVLIPKTDSPQSMKDYRPIALCNVLYKIISKVLCNRLKNSLRGLVDQAQSAFVEGRAIQDNILIAFEAIHSMKRKNKGKFGDMALKIDISKAYDRVDWTCLPFFGGWVSAESGSVGCRLDADVCLHC